MKKNEEQIITVGKITPVKYVKVEFEMNDFARNLLLSHARQHILSDESALLAWAVEQALRNGMDERHERKPKRDRRKT